MYWHLFFDFYVRFIERAEEDMAETKEDMKITKFKIMTEGIQRYLWASKIWADSYNLLSYYPAFINKYVENEYVQAIRTQFMLTTEELERYCGKALHNESEYIHTATSAYSRAIFVIYRRITDNGVDGTWEESDKKDTYTLIFWLLFLAAIDEDLYNNELSSIIDFAYCLKFDESMIRDWCNAVKYVLEGNHLNEACDLQCATDAGKEFFLHQ